MYTRYNRYCGCCNQNNIDNQVLENVCDDLNQNAVQYSNTPCCGLKMGTIFPELVSPYRPGQSMEFNDYLRARNEIGEGCNR